MNRKLKLFSIVLINLCACAPEPPQMVRVTETPKTILHSKPLGDGGLITRNLFRSFWMLPSSDSDLIHIGIVPSSNTIKLTADRHFVIRVYGENESFDVQSPGGVVWEFEFSSIVRPPLLRYLVTVDETFSKNGQDFPALSTQKWLEKGYPNAKWIGPPKMDAWDDTHTIKRYFLTLDILNEKEEAQAMCRMVASKSFSPCKVITRMDLPHLAKGVFRAQQSNFQKEFEGVIEIIPYKKDPVRIFDVKLDYLSDTGKNLTYSPKIFIVPNIDNSLSLVQTTNFSEYLKSVLPSEIYPNAPLEAIKAQAVIARTYIFQTKDSYANKPFLICASTACQVYTGEKTKNESSKTMEKGIDQTRNIILKEPDGDFAEAFYHSSSGGKTDMKNLMFGGRQKPYLEGIDDFIDPDHLDLTKNRDVEKLMESNPPTYCSISRFSKNVTWSYHFDQDQIKKFLESVELQPPLQSIEVLQRGYSGRISSLKIKADGQYKIIKNELKIRAFFGGLPSSLIVFKPQVSAGGIQSLTINGRGSGHGVGMSQLGAIGRAMEGQDYKKILNSYYPGTVLTFIEP